MEENHGEGGSAANSENTEQVSALALSLLGAGAISRRKAFSLLTAGGLSSISAITLLRGAPAQAQDALYPFPTDIIDPLANMGGTELRQLDALRRLMADDQLQAEFLADPGQFTASTGTLLTPGMVRSVGDALIFGDRPDPLRIPVPIETDPTPTPSQQEWPMIADEIGDLYIQYSPYSPQNLDQFDATQANAAAVSAAAAVVSAAAAVVSAYTAASKSNVGYFDELMGNMDQNNQLLDERSNGGQ